MRAVRMLLITLLGVGTVWAGLRFCLARAQISEREALFTLYESWELGETEVPLEALGVPDHVRRDNRFLYCGWRRYHPFGLRWLPRLFNLPGEFSELEVACRRHSEIVVGKWLTGYGADLEPIRVYADTLAECPQK